MRELYDDENCLQFVQLIIWISVTVHLLFIVHLGTAVFYLITATVTWTTNSLAKQNWNNCIWFLQLVITDFWQLVWRSGSGVGHINKVMLHRARLVLGLVTTFSGSTMPVFIQATQPGHPTVVGCNEYWQWFWPPLGKKRRVLRNSGPGYQDC